MARLVHLLPGVKMPHQTNALLLAAMLCVLAPAVGTAQPQRSAQSKRSGAVDTETGIDQLREVSYLVFARSQGFDRPSFEANELEGTVTIRFKRLPRAWKGLLHPQMISERKQRFFGTIVPLVEDDKLTGLIVRVGVGAFAIRSYAKHRPMRWVLRVGERRRPSFEPGPGAVPVIPYSDMVEDDIEGRDLFATAEHDLAVGRNDLACEVFRDLRPGADRDMVPWLALREADCLVRLGNVTTAEAVLHSIIEANQALGAVQLARLRLLETSGRVLRPGLDRTPYIVDPHMATSLGTVADEITFREARAMVFQGDIHEALGILEDLQARRNRSPIFEDRRLLTGLRWRSVWDAFVQKKWLEASTAYLAIPPLPSETPRWAQLQVMGAHALREVGLPRRAVRVYLALLRTPGIVINEHKTLLDLTEAYLESDDVYRTALSLKYIEEQKPKLANHPRILRLQGKVALRANDLPAAAEVATLMKDASPAPTEADARMVLAAAARALEGEGLPTARALAASAGGQLSREFNRDLSMAAGDCDAVISDLSPLYLEEPSSLVWLGACLMGERRVDEAQVFLESARVYAGPQLLSPDMQPMLELLAASAAWWTGHEQRIADVSSATEPQI
ncbi:MAG: hypothetical protein ACI9WU_001385 [Myxococcota bacterium]